MTSFILQSMTLVCTNKSTGSNLPIRLSFVCVPFSNLKTLLISIANQKHLGLIYITEFHANSEVTNQNETLCTKKTNDEKMLYLLLSKNLNNKKALSDLMDKKEQPWCNTPFLSSILDIQI